LAKKRKKAGYAPRVAPEPPRPGAALLVLACALALASGAWALQLWRQLAAARAGLEVTCAFDSEGDCASVWQSGFAAAIESATGLPIAGHGVLWALVALAFPAAVLVARSRGRRGDVSFAAALATALAGILAVVVLAGAQLAEGRFCGSCGVAYALTLSYAAVCLFGAGRAPWRELVRGGLLAAAAAGLGGVTLALASSEQAPPRSASLPGPAALPALPRGAPADDNLERFLASLAPPVSQSLALALREYAASEAKPLHEPRALEGSPMAPVRITDFADFLCGHCASLHGTLAQLKQRAPEGSFAIESRYFPLDGACNAQIPRASGDPVRCTAARVMICLADTPGAFDVAGELYAHQQGLSVDQVYERASKLRPRAELEACASSPETEAKLQGDIAWAVEHHISGTPLVLVNGRKASGFPAFLWALVLAGGNPAHASFAALPQPKGG
jgi:serine/threonine-protein kinase